MCYFIIIAFNDKLQSGQFDIILRLHQRIQLMLFMRFRSIFYSHTAFSAVECV